MPPNTCLARAGWNGTANRAGDAHEIDDAQGLAHHFLGKPLERLARGTIEEREIASSKGAAVSSVLPALSQNRRPPSGLIGDAAGAAQQLADQPAIGDAQHREFDAKGSARTSSSAFSSGDRDRPQCSKHSMRPE